MAGKLATCAVFVLVFSHSIVAQERGPLADIEIVRVKPGLEEKFEAVQKIHWQWHKRQGDKWSWFVWTIESGDNIGAYVVASFGRSWTELDREFEILAPTPNPEADTGPFHQSVQEGYYIFRNDLDSSVDMTNPSPFASFTKVIVKADSVADFEAGLKNVHTLATSLGLGEVAGGRWYELKNGGDWPQFLLIEDRSSWANFQEGRLFESLMKASPAGPGAEVLLRFQRSILSVRTEALRYHPGLSKIEDTH